MPADRWAAQKTGSSDGQKYKASGVHRKMGGLDRMQH